MKSQRSLAWCMVLFSLALLAHAGEPDSAANKKITKADVEAMMKSCSNAGRWGADDELGALNLITPAKRRLAAALVTDGISVSLARRLEPGGTNNSQSFRHKMLALPQAADITSSSDEYALAYHGFTLTHLDALCHLFYKGHTYNGFPQTAVTARGAAKLSVENMRQGIFTRCVLVDMPRLLGTRFLEGGRAILPADLAAWEQFARVKVESGDALLIRTGSWARRRAEGDWEILKSTAGLHATCLPWLRERDVAVVGSDLALDVLPSGVEGFEMPVHWTVVTAMGMPILDNCDLEALGEAAQARRRWAFLLTVAPLAVAGGTGSPVNPLATF